MLFCLKSYQRELKLAEKGSYHVSLFLKDRKLLPNRLVHNMFHCLPIIRVTYNANLDDDMNDVLVLFY